MVKRAAVAETQVAVALKGAVAVVEVKTVARVLLAAHLGHYLGHQVAEAQAEAQAKAQAEAQAAMGALALARVEAGWAAVSLVVR